MSTPCNVNGTCSILTGTTTQRSKVLKPAREKQLNKVITLAFLFLFFIIFGNVLYAQSGTSNRQTMEVAAKEGTYQFIFRSPGSEQNIALTAVQLSAIENLRKDNEVVYAASVSNDYIKVKILPRSVISQASSSSLPKYIFKSEMEFEELHNIRYAEIP